ncbi:MAG: S41 family peptidase [Christensenellales bacterium]|jgi:carboxyl-terminal processing protease
MKRNTFKATGIVIAIIVGLLCGVLGWSFGKAGMFSDGMVGIHAEQYNLYQQYAQEASLVEVIKERYYKDVDTVDFSSGALKGVANALGDPYSEYLTPEEYEMLVESSTGTFYGIGVEFLLNDMGRAVIQSVYPDSPAEKAGIKANDIILKVDGESIDGLSSTQIAGKIRGDENVPVNITILRDNQEMEFQPVRGPLSEVSIHTTMLENNIGYIQLVQFYPDSPDEFSKGLADLKNQGAKSIILDIRSNPGGLFDSAISIADQILGDAPIVSTVSRGETQQSYRSDANKLELPLVVLCNEYSASASEILVGALQDNQAAAIVGVQTYGKGLVQSILPLSESGDALRLTTEEYLTPNGTAINSVGITPDYSVALPDDVLDGTADLTPENDTQLQKAIGLLSAS